MVDFPSNPNDGDTHFENGQSWAYKDPPGAWALLGGAPVQAVEIVEADAPAGWQVWGDLLIQWGESVQVAGDRTITLPQPYKDALYSVSFSVNRRADGTPQPIVGMNTPRLPESFSFRVNDTNGSPITELARWMTIGEAPDVLKKPKEVAAGSGGIGGGSAGPYYEEFHDPNDEYSWRITGTTLECWGTILPPNSNAFTVNLPKTFKRLPTITIGNQGNWVSGGLAVYNTTYDPATTTSSSFRVRTTGSNKDWTGHGTREFGYHCIGEWDGVS